MYETKLPRWVCEYCYRIFYGTKLPDDWDFVWQSAVCPDCKGKVAQDGGYGVVPGGKYAIGPDPRAGLSTHHCGPEQPLSAEDTTGFAVGDPFKEHGMVAAGKKLCGMCGGKAPGREWRCTRLIDQSSQGNYRPLNRGVPGGYFYVCPNPDGNCPGFLKNPSVKRHSQPKKKGLPVPPGVKFIYIGAPRGKTKKGSPQHQGVVTVAWIEPSPGTLHLAFSFCSPKDRWCKATGRDMALARLLHPAVIPCLYSPKRTVHEVVRAVLTHDFMRIYTLAPGATMLGMVPSWTKALVKRMATRRVSGIGRLFPFNIPIPLNIIAHMMADIAKLEIK